MNILDINMQENDAGASTIREYLKTLLTTLWEEGEGFDGKRPFGNSGWEYDLYKALIKAGVCGGEFDEYGCIKYVNHSIGNELIFQAIEQLN